MKKNTSGDGEKPEVDPRIDDIGLTDEEADETRDILKEIKEERIAKEEKGKRSQ